MRNAPASTAARETVRNAPGMPALLLLTATGFSGFAALLPTAPLWAVRGGADAAGAGSVNAVLMLCTVGAQTLVPTAIRRLGWRTTLVCGMVLLGAPRSRTSCRHSSAWCWPSRRCAASDSGC